MQENGRWVRCACMSITVGYQKNLSLIFQFKNVWRFSVKRYKNQITGHIFFLKRHSIQWNRRNFSRLEVFISIATIFHVQYFQQNKFMEINLSVMYSRLTTTGLVDHGHDSPPPSDPIMRFFFTTVHEIFPD